eukprot:2861995-Rhodomonas_salina.1
MKKAPEFGAAFACTSTSAVPDTPPRLARTRRRYLTPETKTAGATRSLVDGAASRLRRSERSIPLGGADHDTAALASTTASASSFSLGLNRSRETSFSSTGSTGLAVTLMRTVDATLVELPLLRAASANMKTGNAPPEVSATDAVCVAWSGTIWKLASRLRQVEIAPVVVSSAAQFHCRTSGLSAFSDGERIRILEADTVRSPPRIRETGCEDTTEIVTDAVDETAGERDMKASTVAMYVAAGSRK